MNLHIIPETPEMTMIGESCVLVQELVVSVDNFKVKKEKGKFLINLVSKNILINGKKCEVWAD